MLFYREGSPTKIDCSKKLVPSPESYEFFLGGSDGRSRILFGVYVGVLFPGQLGIIWLSLSLSLSVFLSLSFSLSLTNNF